MAPESARDKGKTIWVSRAVHDRLRRRAFETGRPLGVIAGEILAAALAPARKSPRRRPEAAST